MAFDIQTIYDKGKDKNIPWDTLQALIDNGGSDGGSGDEDGSTYRIDCEIAEDELLSTSRTFEEIKRAYDNGSVPYCYVTENRSSSNQNMFNYFKLDLRGYLDVKSVEPNFKSFNFANSFIYPNSNNENYLLHLVIEFSNTNDPQLSIYQNYWNGTPDE